jgi:hypothetical protein
MSTAEGRLRSRRTYSDGVDLTGTACGITFLRLAARRVVTLADRAKQRRARTDDYQTVFDRLSGFVRHAATEECLLHCVIEVELVPRRLVLLDIDLLALKLPNQPQ